MSFASKVIIITGASSGIGADAARHLAKLGGSIAMVGRNEKRLNEVVAEIKKTGSPASLPIVADVTKDAQRIIDETIKHFGKLNVLVNNAGIASHDSISEFQLNEFDRIFNTNVRSIAVLMNLAIPHLEKTKGNIINISSSAALKVLPTFTSYCVSKAALDHLTRCVALELAPKGIRVNSINPGAIRTPIPQTMGRTAEESEQMWDAYVCQHPIGRVGVVLDTSTAIAYLASDSSSFITGALLTVDGGFTLA